MPVGAIEGLDESRMLRFRPKFKRLQDRRAIGRQRSDLLLLLELELLLLLLCCEQLLHERGGDVGRVERRKCCSIDHGRRNVRRNVRGRAGSGPAGTLYDLAWKALDLTHAETGTCKR